MGNTPSIETLKNKYEFKPSAFYNNKPMRIASNIILWILVITI